jgi:hypothetical protein
MLKLVFLRLETQANTTSCVHIRSSAAPHVELQSEGNCPNWAGGHRYGVAEYTVFLTLFSPVPYWWFVNILVCLHECTRHLVAWSIRKVLLIGALCLNYVCLVGFEVVTVVVMKSIIFWDITPCSLLKVNRRFGGTYCLHLQGWRISWERNHIGCRWQAELLLSRKAIYIWRVSELSSPY